MLIDDPQATRSDPVAAIVASVNGNDARVVRLRQGVYQRGDFGSSPWRDGYEGYPEIDGIGPYGVCDGYEQILARCPDLEASERQFIVMLTPVRRANQSPEGGWRWHKWGEYIGTQEPKHEYLYDEEGIEQVFCFHIYEKQTVAA